MSVWETKEAPERLFLPILNSILMVCQSLKVVFEMRYLQVSEAFRCEAQREFMAQLFYLASAL